jgi:hypothetical protein
MKRCSICKNAEYCGAACQKAGWKQHKKKCAAPPIQMPFKEVLHRIAAATPNGVPDWREVLQWEGRVEELVQKLPAAASIEILQIFVTSHMLKLSATGCADAYLAMAKLEERRIDLLGEQQLFRDQGGGPQPSFLGRMGRALPFNGRVTSRTPPLRARESCFI